MSKESRTFHARVGLMKIAVVLKLATRRSLLALARILASLLLLYSTVPTGKLDVWLKDKLLHQFIYARLCTSYWCFGMLFIKLIDLSTLRSLLFSFLLAFEYSPLQTMWHIVKRKEKSKSFVTKLLKFIGSSSIGEYARASLENERGKGNRPVLVPFYGKQGPSWHIPSQCSWKVSTVVMKKLSKKNTYYTIKIDTCLNFEGLH